MMKTTQRQMMMRMGSFGGTWSASNLAVAIAAIALRGRLVSQRCSDCSYQRCASIAQQDASLAQARVRRVSSFVLHGFSRKSYTSSGLSFALRPVKQRVKKVEWSELKQVCQVGRRLELRKAY